MATTLEAIQAKMDKLKAQADALIAKQSSGVIEKIRDLMTKHGLTTADIDTHVGGRQRATKAVAKTMSNGSAAAVKYRDPKSGATWTGHGRAPSWIAAAKNRDKFLVNGSTATTKPAPVSKVKTAGNYVRGPQPAMYQDPTSGATWSGRGRAPGWIVNVKDRSKFLIAGGAEVTVAANADVVSKAKVAVKKAPKAVGATSTEGQPKGPAPAWLSGAKDRAKFLIVGASAAADAKPAVTKAVAKKAPTTKKTAAKKAVSAKAPAKKSPRKSVAVPAPLATVESGAELTT
jgi:DNA-binding protein H-NS